MLIPSWSKSRRPNLVIFVVGAAHMGDSDGHIFRRVGYPWHLKLLPTPSIDCKVKLKVLYIDFLRALFNTIIKRCVSMLGLPFQSGVRAAMTSSHTERFRDALQSAHTERIRTSELPLCSYSFHGQA